VGFRLNVQELARRLPVTGMVRNVSDGSVELVAIGSSKSLMELLAAVDQRMARNIVNCTVQWSDGDLGEYAEFAIGSDKWGG
jgi:acylphosphatase